MQDQPISPVTELTQELIEQRLDEIIQLVQSHPDGSGPTLFGLTGASLALEQLLNELGGEFNDEQLFEAVQMLMQGLEADIPQKMAAYIKVIKQHEKMAEAIREEEIRLASLRKTHENTCARLRKNMALSMESLGASRIETPFGNVSYREVGKPRLEIDEEAFNSAARCLCLSKDHYDDVVVPNKQAIRKALEAGEELSFARLLSKEKTISIR